MIEHLRKELTDANNTICVLRQGFAEVNQELEAYKKALEGVPVEAVVDGGWNLKGFYQFSIAPFVDDKNMLDFILSHDCHIEKHDDDRFYYLTSEGDIVGSGVAAKEAIKSAMEASNGN
jgi:hypothetical protein